MCSRADSSCVRMGRIPHLFLKNVGEIEHQSSTESPSPREVLEEGEGGGGSWTQMFVYQKWPNQILPIVNFVFSHDGHHRGATTTGPDATYPPAICQNSGGGGAELGGGGPAGGQGGGVRPGVGGGGSSRGSGGGSC